MKKLVVCMVISLISFSAFSQEKRMSMKLGSSMSLPASLDDIRAKIAQAFDNNSDISSSGLRQGFFDQYNKQRPYTNPMIDIVRSFYNQDNGLIRQINLDISNNCILSHDSIDYKNEVHRLAGVISDKEAYKNLLLFLQIITVHSYVTNGMDYKDAPDVSMINDISIKIGKPLEVDVCLSIFHENCDVLFSSVKN